MPSPFSGDDMLTAETVRKLLDYDPETGVFRWRTSGRGRKGSGSVAGCAKHYRGYASVHVLGKSYASHRLAWLYVYGEWPSDEIDHINTIKDDNRIVNLRIASRSQNKANCKAKCNNLTGFKGVHLDKFGKFQAKITLNNRQRHLGRFDTAEEAHAAYCAAAEKHFGEFARFE